MMLTAVNLGSVYGAWYWRPDCHSAKWWWDDAVMPSRHPLHTHIRFHPCLYWPHRWCWFLLQSQRRLLQEHQKCLHIDRGSEYMLDAFITFLDERGLHGSWLYMTHLRRMTLLRGWTVSWWNAFEPWLAFATPYERVSGNPATLTDLPIWGGLAWVLDSLDGKLTAHVCEGHWVGFALESNRHRATGQGRGLSRAMEEKLLTVRCVWHVTCRLGGKTGGIMVEWETAGGFAKNATASFSSDCGKSHWWLCL